MPALLSVYHKDNPASDVPSFPDDGGDDFISLVEAIPQIVWVISPEGSLIYSNERWRTYTGLTMEESHGEGWTKVVHPDDVEVAAQKWEEAFRKKTVYEIQYRLRRVDGVYRWHLTRVAPLKDGKGKVIRWFGTSTDIDDQIAKRAELERRKNEFISMASHELKTPIATIKGFTQILYELFKNDEKASHYLSKMDSQINRVTLLVNDLLDVSRIESGKLHLHYEIFKIENLVKEVVEDMQAQSQRHTIIFKSNSEATIRGDYFRLSQVFTNLISNAIKYSPKADKVIVSLEDTNEGVTIEVKDFGIGIAKKNLDKVFEMFYQVDNKIRPSFSGLGLGLHISQKIIKRHGGEIAVASEKGEGSIFTVYLPGKR